MEATELLAEAAIQAERISPLALQATQPFLRAGPVTVAVLILDVVDVDPFLAVGQHSLRKIQSTSQITLAEKCRASIDGGHVATIAHCRNELYSHQAAASKLLCQAASLEFTPRPVRFPPVCLPAPLRPRSAGRRGRWAMSVCVASALYTSRAT